MRETFELYWDEITAWAALLDILLIFVTVPWVLTIKKDPMSALAWSLVIVLLPFVGTVLFVLLGWQQVHRPLSRKTRHKEKYRTQFIDIGSGELAPDRRSESAIEGPWSGMARLAAQLDASPVTPGNRVSLYFEGNPAFAAKREAMRAARHHIHLEYFIFQPDELGTEVLQILTEKVKQGVEVRLLYDAMGSHRLHHQMLSGLRAAGGKCRSFLPLDPLRRRIQINMRNHRKILVVDGEVAFTGGLNIGDEYLGKNPRFGFWRDTHMRIEGPAVSSLQRIFSEDWDFASGEHLRGKAYFPQSVYVSRETTSTAMDCTLQVIHSGPDQAVKSIREIYFAAILRARQRLWIASPYFVPDAALFDAVCLAGYAGVDVRLLCQFHPDKWIPYYAARYYWDDVLASGVKVYQYTRGMMHSKVILVDGEWGTVGTANFDNRSMHLNFEVNCLLYSAEAVAELERAFIRDLGTAIELDREVFARRPFAGRLVENACRLFSPIL